MSETTVTRLFIGSGIAIISGAILAVGAVWLAVANNVFVMAGADVVGIEGGHLGGPSSEPASLAAWPSRAGRSAASCRGSVPC